jgi:hypothetical protein
MTDEDEGDIGWMGWLDDLDDWVVGKKHGKFHGRKLNH